MSLFGVSVAGISLYMVRTGWRSERIAMREGRRGKVVEGGENEREGRRRQRKGGQGRGGKGEVTCIKQQ